MKFQFFDMSDPSIFRHFLIFHSLFHPQNTMIVEAKILECNLDYTFQRSNKQNGKYTKKSSRDQFF